MLDASGVVPLLVALAVVAGAVLLRLRQVEQGALGRARSKVAQAQAELAALEEDLATRARDRDQLRDATTALVAARKELARVQEDVERTRSELDASSALLAEQRAALAAATAAAAAASAPAAPAAPGPVAPERPVAAPRGVTSTPRGGIDLGAVLDASGSGDVPIDGVVRAVRPDEPAPVEEEGS